MRRASCERRFDLARWLRELISYLASMRIEMQH